MLILAHGAGANSPLPQSSSLSGAYLAGRTAGKSRDTEASALYVRQALQLDSKNMVLVERLFQLELANGNFAAAEALATDVLAFNSQQRMARVVLGIKAMRDRQYAAAREHFAEAAYTPVGELTSILLTAWSFAGEGNFQSASEALDKLDGNDGFANFKSFHLALIADLLQNNLRAETAYRKAYGDAGSSLRVTLAYGNYLARTGRIDEAEKVFSEYLANGERNVLVEAALDGVKRKDVPAPFVATVAGGAAEALFSLAAAMNDDQSIDVALVYAQLALSFNADKPVVLTLLGDILATAQRNEAAIDVFEQVPATSELRSNADLEIAINLQRLERPDDAQARIKTILAREPKNADVWVTLGNLMRNTEKYDEAVAAYDSAITLLEAQGQANWPVYYYRGISLERQKNWVRAEADFRKALSIAPQEPSILNYLGYSLIDSGIKLDEAIAMVKKAVSLKPNDGYIVDSLGWAYFQLGDYEQALEHMERAVDLRPGDATIAEHLGDVYWRVGRKLEAQFQWQHAKDNRPEPKDLLRIEDKLKNGLPPLPAPVTPADNGKKAPSNG